MDIKKEDSMELDQDDGIDNFKDQTFDYGNEDGTTVGGGLGTNALKPKPMGPMMGKLKIAKLGVPTLDFSNLKTVKEYKDWYGYSQKLENAIALLREKIEGLENERDLV